MMAQLVAQRKKSLQSAALVLEPPTEIGLAPTSASSNEHQFSAVPLLRPQAKMTVSQPDDPQEQEAEKTADEVMRAEASSRDDAKREKPNELSEGAVAARQVMRDPAPAAPPSADPNAPTPALAAPQTDPNAVAGDPLKAGGGGGGSTTITVTPSVRPLSAPSLSQLWDVMTNSGTRESASVLPKFQPEPQYEYDGNNNVTKATITVIETKEMPQWQELPAQCPPIAAEWNRFYGVIDTHENNHLAIDKKHFANLHAKLIGKPQATAWKMVDDEIEAADKENEAYDATSNHGVNEGANINTAVQCAPEKVQSSDAGGPGNAPTSPNPTVDPTSLSTLPPTAQAKLTVSRPTDPAEQEADHMADRVLRMPAPIIQRACAGPGKCDCDECRAKQADQVAREASRNDDQADDVSPIVAAGLSGGGHPLDDASRSYLEPRFGHDFSRVRVHTDARAAQSADAVAARAYTVGGDIAFASGEYHPGSAEGRRLLAHELTHTIQQGAVQRQVMRDDNDNPNSDAHQIELIKKALQSKSPSDVHDINQYRLILASEADRFTLLDILLNHNSFVGPIDATYIEAIWNSFGKQLITLLDNQKNLDLWKQCNDHLLVNLNGISELAGLKEQFKADILTKVHGYLSQNREWVNAEIKRLGLDNLQAPATADQDKERQEMQEAAKRLQPALDNKKKLEEIILGYHINATSVPLDHGEPVRFGDSTDQEPSMAEHAPGAPAWQKVKEQHTPLVAVIQNVTDKYPTLYGLIKDDKVQDFENGKDEGQLRKMMSDSLHNVLTNIDKTDAELSGTGNTLLLELQPIHEQLYQESPVWSKPFAKSVAQQSTQAYKDDKFWEQLGLSTLGAALFIFASVATSGAAIAMVAAGAGISAGQATQSWLDYEKMNAASQTNLSDKTALIRGSDVNAALIDAVLATVAAFLDAYAAAKEVQAAVASGDEAAKAAAEAKVEGAQDRLAGAEGKEAQEADAAAAQKELKDSQEVHFQDSRGEAHEYVLQDDGVGMCSDHCGLFQAKIQERLDKLPGKPPAGKELLANAAKIDQDALRLKPNLDAKAAAWQKAEDVAKSAEPANRMDAKRAALDAKKEWSTLNDQWKAIADRETQIEAALGKVEQEEAMNAKLGAEGYSQQWGVTDMEKQKALGVKTGKGPDGNTTFSDASGNPLASGETADFVGKSPNGRYKIAESKRAEAMSKGADVEKAYSQLVNTDQALLAKEPAARGSIDFEIWVDDRSLGMLQKIESDGSMKGIANIDGSKYVVNDKGYLQYVPVGGVPITQAIDGAPVLVRTP